MVQINNDAQQGRVIIDSGARVNGGKGRVVMTIEFFDNLQGFFIVANGFVDKGFEDVVFRCKKALEGSNLLK